MSPTYIKMLYNDVHNFMSLLKTVLLIYREPNLFTRCTELDLFVKFQLNWKPGSGSNVTSKVPPSQIKLNRAC